MPPDPLGCTLRCAFPVVSLHFDPLFKKSRSAPGIFVMITVSRHTIVCRAAQEAGVPHCGYIDRKKMSFSHHCISVIPIRLEPNLLQSCQPTRGVYIPNLKEITLAISEIQAAKLSIFIFVFFSLCFRTLAKIAINTNAYSDHLEIWHRERESKGES